MLRIASCQCGLVECQASGDPILSAVCYCHDCQEGGGRIETLPGAAAVRDPDGGTPYLTYRDDRFRCVAGAEFLRAERLRPDSPTRRMVTSCCNTGMFLKFEKGHWTSAYRLRFTGDLPPITMRTNVKCRNSPLPFPDNALRYRTFGLQLFGKLIAARFAMFLGR